MRSAFVCVVILLAGCGPQKPEYDAKVPGELLGTFAVSGKIAEDQCGAELLGAPDPWNFEVRLSQLGTDIYWLNGREAIVGDIEPSSGQFRFSTRVDVAISPSGGGKPGCVVSRHDRAEGKLAASEGNGGSVLGFEALLSFEYRPRSELECFEIIGVPGGLQGLPCALSYRVTAERMAPAP